jgi:hypothetical protein
MGEKSVAFRVGDDLKVGTSLVGVRFENAAELADRLRGRSAYPFPTAADLAVDIDNAIKKRHHTAVSLDDEKKAALRAVIEDWLREEGFLRLPPDIWNLRVALLDVAGAESQG